MSESSEAKHLFNVGIIAAFATLSFIGTLLIRIPIPATGGYFNLGDTFVMAAALLYGPWVGALVGLIEATIVGYVIGCFCAWLHNSLIGSYIYLVRRSAEAKQRRDIL